MAEDELTNERIAAACGVSRQALAKWKAAPEFQTRVTAIRAELDAAVMRYAIAKRRNRVRRLTQDWERLQAIVAARAAAMQGEAPGAETGLLVRTEKHIGQMEIVEYTVDTGLLKELRDSEKQAAQELQQWVDKSERKHDGSEDFLAALRAFAHDDDSD